MIYNVVIYEVYLPECHNQMKADMSQWCPTSAYTVIVFDSGPRETWPVGDEPAVVHRGWDLVRDINWGLKYTKEGSS